MFRMARYPAIWEVELDFDVSLLLEEFTSAFSKNLRKVYAKNNDWKGVSVFKKGENLDLGNLPEVERVVSQIGKSNVMGIGYFNLETDSRLHEHRDMNGNLLFGIIRIHIPIKTNENAYLFVERVRYHLPLGTSWALDTSGRHALANGSISNRIHLVIDIKKSAETIKFFPRWTTSVVLHLINVIFVMSIKIVRDLFLNPNSLRKRLKDKIKEIH